MFLNRQKKSHDHHFQTEHLKDNIGVTTARGSLITFGWHGMKFVVGITATALMARLLKPEDYGLIGMVAVITTYISMFKDMGLSMATVQKAEINYEQVSTLFWINVALSLVISVFTIGVAPLIAWLYHEPKLTAISMVTTIGFVVGGLAVQHEALLKRQMKFGALGLIGFVAMVMGYVVGVLMAWRGFGYWSLVGSQLGLIGTNTLLVWFVCGWIPGWPQRNAGVKPMLNLGKNITGFAMLNVFARNMDVLVIGRQLGAQPVGLYAKAYQLVNLPTDNTNEPLNTVALPALSRLADDPVRYRDAYLRMLEKVVLVVMPCVAVMFVASDWIVQVVLGPQWSQTASVLSLLALSALMYPVANSALWLMISQGRGNDMFRWAVLGAPLSILSYVIGLKWGVVGVAASYSLARLFVIDPLLYFYAGKTGPVRTRDIYRSTLPFVAAAVASVFVCLIFRKFATITHPFVGLIICAVLVAITDVLVLGALPIGRAAIRDAVQTLLLFFHRKPPAEVGA
ncbi:MAG TPA: lipopolysaccharide biosynthesis protein [Pyrinomonadaceae bacterium]